MQQGYSSAPEPSGPLGKNAAGAFLEDLSRAAKKLIELNRALTNQLERWHGPRPSAVTPVTEKPEVGGGHLNRINEAFSLVESLIEQANSKASELDKIG